MPGNGISLLAVGRGTITAPAGCGKTHLIVEALTNRAETKPILVLTHTNAGVAALRERLDRIYVPSSTYQLATIDGWAMRLISTFPSRSGHAPGLLNLSNPKNDYLNIRVATAGLINGEHISDILTASYSRLIVDEYQDCSVRQHAIVVAVAQILPTCVLGDPMQAIFGFGDDALANWDEQVCAVFPIVAQLGTPWRWINAGAQQLGYWLLDVREKLLRGEPIDLRAAPASVKWVKLDGSGDHERRLSAARVTPPVDNGCVLIVRDGKYPKSHGQFAGQTPGATTVEAVDLKDFVSFAQTFDLASPQAFTDLANFAQTVMTNVGGDDLVRRVESLMQGRARKPPSESETAAIAFVREPSYRAAANVLTAISKKEGVRTHRPIILRSCIKAFQVCGKSGGPSFFEAAIRMREQNRLVGRRLPRRAVGSTLLLKGLEGEVAVILDADALNTQNLYVAMTRGSHALTVCSRSPILSPG